MLLDWFWDRIKVVSRQYYGPLSSTLDIVIWDWVGGNRIRIILGRLKSGLRIILNFMTYFFQQFGLYCLLHEIYIIIESELILETYHTVLLDWFWNRIKFVSRIMVISAVHLCCVLVPILALDQNDIVAFQIRVVEPEPCWCYAVWDRFKCVLALSRQHFHTIFCSTNFYIVSSVCCLILSMLGTDVGTILNSFQDLLGKMFEANVEHFHTIFAVPVLILYREYFLYVFLSRLGIVVLIF